VRWESLAAFLALLFLTACSRESDSPVLSTASGSHTPRVVTLAPHLAELVFAVGAGESLVGVSAYSNYPPDVLDLPQIGDAFLIDQEQLLLLHPDILLAWENGTAVRTVDELRDRGYRVEVIRTDGLHDIASAVVTIGQLTGHQAEAGVVATDFLADIEGLRERFAQESEIRVFYQVAPRPLYTVNSEHYVSELIDLCGGKNIFSDLGALAPLVSEESVLVRDPEILLAGRITGGDATLGDWQRWPVLTANILGNFYYIPADLLARPTPRLVQTGGLICEALQKGRQNRALQRKHQRTLDATLP
jgi:iron complex transport system substrate-binding protein